MDMTGFIAILIGIATISATIVAILGGYIFSKHINIGDNKSLVEKQINEAEGTKKPSIDRREELLKKLLARDVINFISDNHDRIMKPSADDGGFEAAYGELSHPYIPNSLQELCKNFFSTCWDITIRMKGIFNSIGVEKTKKMYPWKIVNYLTMEYGDDDLYRALGCIFLSWNSSLGGLDTRGYCADTIEKYKLNMIIFDSEREQIIRDILECNKKIENIQFHIDWLKNEENNIRRPKGLESAKYIFAYLAICCVIGPLMALTMVCVAFPKADNCQKVLVVVFAALLCIGIIMICVYLSWLFKEKKSKNPRWQNDM